MNWTQSPFHSDRNNLQRQETDESKSRKHSMRLYIAIVLLAVVHLHFAAAGQLGLRRAKINPQPDAAMMPEFSYADNVDKEFQNGERKSSEPKKSCGCSEGADGNSALGSNSMTLLEVNCQGIQCKCESEMNEFEAYSRRKSEGRRPDGRCYFHVANFIDAMGYGGIKKNGFNSCVGSQYHSYAYQFHSAIGSGKCGLKDVKEQYGNNPYNAPRGALVVVKAGTPGTAHPVAGDIAVASGDGRFWNGGNMAYGGKNHEYAGQLLAIYVPSTCTSRPNDQGGDQEDGNDTEANKNGDGSKASGMVQGIETDSPNKEREQHLINACHEAGLRGSEARQFMAQCSHECAHFNTMEEYASGADYEGRSDLGNTQPGDGKRFKGRGYIQLTGRANYRDVGRAIGVDLENNPKKAEEPEIAAKTALHFWKTRVRARVSNFCDTTAVTLVINGGRNGLQDRINKFAKYGGCNGGQQGGNSNSVRLGTTSEDEEVNPGERDATSSHGDCIACIKSGGGKGCMSRCPQRPYCQKCIQHMGGKACAERCE